MTEQELINYQGRAILGNIRNMSFDRVANVRPRTQYMGFWRTTKRKLAEVMKKKDLIDPEILVKLISIKGVLDQYQKPTNSEALEISMGCLSALGEK